MRRIQRTRDLGHERPYAARDVVSDAPIKNAARGLSLFLLTGEDFRFDDYHFGRVGAGAGHIVVVAIPDVACDPVIGPSRRCREIPRCVIVIPGGDRNGCRSEGRRVAASAVVRSIKLKG